MGREPPVVIWSETSARELAAELGAFDPSQPTEVLPIHLASYRNYYGLEPDYGIAGVDYSIGCLESGPFTLAVQFWRHPQATSTLCVLHGYLDHVGLYGHLIEFALRQGCNVLTFDLPGHGLSSGESATIDNFEHYGDAVRDVVSTVLPLGLPVWAMAQSTGCAALMQFARMGDWPFLHTVFLAPLVRPAKWQLVRAAHVLLSRFRHHVPRKFSPNSSDEDFLAKVRQDPLQSRQLSVEWVGALRVWLKSLPLTDLGVGPVLVIQGDKDHTVAWKYNMKAIERLFPGSKIAYIPGAGHHLANESEALRQRYLPVVAEYCGLT